MLKKKQWYKVKFEAFVTKSEAKEIKKKMYDVMKESFGTDHCTGISVRKEDMNCPFDKGKDINCDGCEYICEYCLSEYMETDDE